jgi:uncharacterized protein (TIGR03437 family)
MSFSGSGTYNVSAIVLDSDAKGFGNLSASGTYSISASGYGWISHPFFPSDVIRGLVSNGVFIGSSTEGGFNDLFIAARLDAPQAGLGTLRGGYTLAYLELSSGSPYTAYDALWQMSPDGAGNLGTVALSGFSGSGGSSVISQSLTGVKYIFSNGAANMMFPRSNTAMLSGNEYMYFSPDGNFVFGGSPEGWDFFVGVRNPSSAPALNGLYFQAGLAEDDSTLQAGYGTLSTYYGAFSAGSGAVVGHQRELSIFGTTPVDYSYSDAYSVPAGGGYTDSATSTRYVVGSGGQRIGLGIGPFLGIAAALPVTQASPQDVYLNPAGIVNAASSAPFTAGIAPGELITLYGANLAPSTAVAPGAPFPTSLAGVQVTINDTPAPLYYVSPEQASVVVPYGLAQGVAQIQVTNNGASSNVVTVFTNTAVPGVFTNPVGGLGYAAALHAADNSPVTTSNPAKIGEYISVYVTGLGAVSPAITDGAPGPVESLSQTTGKIAVGVAGRAATVSYSGLAPQLAGLYQINFQMPAAVPPGDAVLTIAGPNFFSSQALITVGTSSTGASVPASSLQAARQFRRTLPETQTAHE